VASDNVLILRAGRNTNNRVENPGILLSFRLPSLSPGKLASYTRFANCQPANTSAPAGRQADFRDAVKSWHTGPFFRVFDFFVVPTLLTRSIAQLLVCRCDTALWKRWPYEES